MSQIVLSTGVSVQSENVRHAEYYPRASLRSNAYINRGLTRHDKDFLFIRLCDGIQHVRGDGAGTDAANLEQAGVTVYRRPMPVVSRTH